VVVSVAVVTTEGLNIEEQQRVKLAFAEGFLAGHTQKTQTKSGKWLRIVQQLLTIILFVSIVVSLMGKHQP
jgi:hypothetical protein